MTGGQMVRLLLKYEIFHIPMKNIKLMVTLKMTDIIATCTGAYYVTSSVHTPANVRRQESYEKGSWYQT